MKHAPLRLAAVALAALAMSHTALAANPRSWVSNTGSDTNPCTLASPCKTFQHAVDNTSAGGEVDVLNPGEYGPINITKAITIDGGNLAHIQATDPIGGVLVKAGPSDSVVVRNLSIAGASVAQVISWTAGAVLYLENVSVFGGKTGISAVAAAGSPYLVARNVFIRQTAHAGVNLQGTGASIMNALLDHVAIDGVSNGDAIDVATGRVVMTHCSVAHPLHIALAASAASLLDVEDSTFAFSSNGLFATGAGTTIRIASSNLHDNQAGIVAAYGGQILSFGTNRISGNGMDETASGTVALK